MDKLQFYKKQYAYLIGEIDQALNELEDHHSECAYQTLEAALRASQTLWLDTFVTETAIMDEDILDKFEARDRASGNTL